MFNTAIDVITVKVFELNLIQHFDDFSICKYFSLKGYKSVTEVFGKPVDGSYMTIYQFFLMINK